MKSGSGTVWFHCYVSEVPVRVDIYPLIEVSQLNTFINPRFSVATENLIHWLMILKIKGNDDTKPIEKREIDIMEIIERKCFVHYSFLVLKTKFSRRFLRQSKLKLVPIKGIM